MKNTLRVACLTVKGIYEECKRRRMIIENGMRGRTDLLRLGGTLLLGSGTGRECGVWEDMKGGTVRTGLDDNYSRRS